MAAVIGGSQRFRYTNKQRTLVFSTRGVSYRARHLMNDVCLGWGILPSSLSLIITPSHPPPPLPIHSCVP